MLLNHVGQSLTGKACTNRVSLEKQHDMLYPETVSEEGITENLSAPHLSPPSLSLPTHLFLGLLQVTKTYQSSQHPDPRARKPAIHEHQHTVYEQCLSFHLLDLPIFVDLLRRKP